MKNISLFNSSKVKKLLKKLEEVYDCNLENLKKKFFYINQKDKLFMVNHKIEERYMKNIFGVGIYFGKFCSKNFKLSFEGSTFITPKKNYLVLNEKDFKKYISLEKFPFEKLKTENYDFPFLIIIYKNKNVGCCSIKEKSVLTYLKKSRRINEEKFF